MTLCGAYAAAAPEEPFPTTAALLEKLQEVLEKADVEVMAMSLLSLRISISSGSMLFLGALVLSVLCLVFLVLHVISVILKSAVLLCLLHLAESHAT